MAYFAILCVALCVAMMLIVISVMNGFLDKIEVAAKGLFGDIVIDAPSLGGVGRYDEFITELREKVPEVEAATPFILAYGFLMIPNEDFRQTVQIAGIRLPERVEATTFGRGLYVQRDVAKPTFDPPISLMLSQMEADVARTEVILKQLEKEAKAIRKELKDCDDADERKTLEAKLSARESLARRISTSVGRRQNIGAMTLLRAAPHQKELARLNKQLDAARAAARDRSEGKEADAVDDLSARINDLVEKTRLQAPANRVILGLDVSPMTFRTSDGDTIRVVSSGESIVLAIIPLGQRDAGGLNEALFTIVDDCTTDVSSMDSKTVYVPFETLQRLNKMDARYAPTPPYDVVIPARCSQIHIKVGEAFSNGEALMGVRNKVLAVWEDFHRRHPDAADARVHVMTWRQHQKGIIGPIEQQRTLSVIMFGVISLVAVVLIFVIFYMIVYQKIRDIGVLKSIGASSIGVAQIFLAYGAAVGLVGSILGTIGGYYFVRYINEIQDKIDQWFGFRVWSREVFMFEKIPNQVNWSDASWIVAFAILFGLLGALVPAIQAARKQPVEALRYE